MNQPAWQYRQTFLRRHVSRMLDCADQVLAVDHLLRKAEARGGCFVGLEHRRWLLDQFFGSDPEQDTTWPEWRVWLPIRLQLTGSMPGVVYPLDSLSALLASLTARSDRRGVLLLARSGAGKTLACLKAFRDCFCRVWGEETATAGGRGLDERTPALLPPPLAGHLPLWLPVTEHVPAMDRLRATPGDAAEGDADLLLDELILRAAGLLRGETGADNGLRAQLAEWLRYSPPLLLFVDLNAADDTVRRALARALSYRQKKFHDSGQPHRCVITYRSVGTKDANITTLRQTGAVLSLDMRPIDAAHAREYLRGYRNLEERFFARLGISRSPRELTVEEERDLLARLVEGHTRGSESVISTPLLMHFASTLDRGLAGIQSVAELYDAVVEQSLARELDPPAVGGTRRSWPGRLADPQDGRKLVKTVMTRVALAILARDSQATRLQADHGIPFDDLLGQLLRYPELRLPGPPSSSWRPTSKFWLEASYYTDKLQIKDEREAVLEASLLRRDESSIGFVHDSFVYYFAGGLALREYGEPGVPLRGTPLPEQWYSEVVAQVREHPDRWQLAAEFLGGTLSYEELRTLVLKLLVAEPKAGLSRVLQRLVIGRLARGQAEDDPVLAELEQALRRPEAHRWPEGLFALCNHWLRDAGAEEPECGAFAHERLERAIAKTDRVWLRSEPAVSRPVGLWHRLHSSQVILAELEDGRIASGGSEGTVIIWDPNSGLTTVVFRHEKDVTCLQVLFGGKLASGGMDGVVAIWGDGDQAQKLFRHSSVVLEIQPLSDGGLAAAYFDGTVVVWDGNSKAAEILQHGDRVDRLQALSGSSGLALASKDGVVSVWTGQGKVYEIFRHGGRVTCLRASPCGGLAAGYDDGVLVIWDGKGDAAEVFQHGGQVTCLQSLLSNGFASGSKDGVVAVWDGQGQIREVIRRGGIVTCLQILSRGGLAAGYDDGVVVVWDANGQATDVFQYKGKVVVLESLPGGGLVAMYEDGVLAVSHDESQMPVYCHHGLTCLMAVSGGGLVTGYHDGVVAVWDGHQIEEAFPHQSDVNDLQGPSEGRLALLLRHGYHVTCLHALSGARLALGYDDGVVNVWDGYDQIQEVFRHTRLLICLQELSGERLAAGYFTGEVVLWDRQGQIREVFRHEGFLTCLKALSGKGLAAFYTDGSVVVWDGHQSKEILQKRSLADYSRQVTCLERLSGGELVVGNSDGVVQVWDDHDQVQEVFRHKGKVSCLEALSGGRLASGDEHGVVAIWDGSGMAKEVFRHDGKVTCLKALPGERPALASGSSGGVVAILDTSTGTKAIFTTFDSVKQLAWLPRTDGRTEEELAILLEGGHVVFVRVWAQGRPFSLNS